MPIRRKINTTTKICHLIHLFNCNKITKPFYCHRRHLVLLHFRRLLLGILPSNRMHPYHLHHLKLHHRLIYHQIKITMIMMVVIIIGLASRRQTHLTQNNSVIVMLPLPLMPQQLISSA